MPFAHRPVPLSDSQSPPLDARATGDGAWQVLFPDGRLLAISSAGVALRRRLDLSGLNREAALMLRVSPEGRFAAVAEEFGTQGRLFDLADEDLTDGGTFHPFERGEYCANVSAFPLDFVSRAGRPLLIHGTDWNRLDITDPVSNELLTPRGPTAYERKEERPPHYLDYFHGRLHLSPKGERIAEDGWIWHPVGVPRTWSVTRWLTENAWESEDGPSLVQLPHRYYFWDGPMAWIDDERLAVWGFGEDEDEMEPGIRIFEATTGQALHAFPGPVVDPQKKWPPNTGPRGWIACDRWLYAISPQRGVEVWEIENGRRLHAESDFVPIAHDRNTGTFLTFREGTLLLSQFHD